MKKFKIATILLAGLIANANAVISYAGNLVYTSYGQERHTTSFNISAIANASTWRDAGAQIFDRYSNSVVGISIDPSGTGFVVTSSANIDLYQNGKFITTTRSNDISDNTITGISYTGNALYLTVIRDNAVDLKGALYKCSALGKDCVKKDHFKHNPTAVSFDNHGTGYVVTTEGNLDKYTNDSYIGKVSYRFEGWPTGVSYTGNDVYVVTTKPNKLYRCTLDNIATCDDMYDFDAKDFPKGSFKSNKPIGVAFDIYGNGYVDSDLTSPSSTQPSYHKALLVFKHNLLDNKLYENDGSTTNITMQNN